MSDDDRDDLVVRALHELPVPEHQPGFWGRLDRAIADEVYVEASDASSAPAHRRLDTSELPAVRTLAHERPGRPRRAPWLAVAAALLVLCGAVGVVAFIGADGDDGDNAELADDSGGSQAPSSDLTTVVPTVASEGSPTTTEVSDTPPPGEPPTPVDAVREWIDALGEGDDETAASLLGPRSVAYLQSVGGDPAGMMQEFEEGYGAWAGSPDVEIAAGQPVPLDLLGPGVELTIVTVAGTYPGEGDSEPRVDVIPVVTDQDGFRVETVAYAPERDNRLVFTVPRSDELGELSDMGPADDVNVFVPSEGTVFFQIDGGELFADATSMVGRNAEPFALYNPPDDLAPGPHQIVVVAVGGDGTITSYGGTFEVA